MHFFHTYNYNNIIDSFTLMGGGLILSTRIFPLKTIEKICIVKCSQISLLTGVSTDLLSPRPYP